MSDAPEAPNDRAPENQPIGPEKRSGSLSYLYEIPLFYGLLFLAQRTFWPENPGFRDVNPSPFWLGLLLFGLRYGMFAGLLSGVASGALLALAARLAGEGYRLGDGEFWFLPGLFVILGACIGGSADSFLHRIASLKSRIGELTDQARGLLRQLQMQQKAMRAVEQQVVSQMSSLVTLYHGSRELGTLEREQLLIGILDFFTRALAATKTGLYVPEGERWVLREQRGWLEADTYPRSVEPGQGLVGRAGAEHRVVSLKEFFTGAEAGELQEGRGSDALMAAPLRSPDGKPVAVFAVQSMPFLRFNSASVNLLTLLADWGDEALAKCVHFEELTAKSIMDEEFSVYSRQYFLARTKQEFARSKRHSLPFSLLLAAPAGLDSIPMARRVAYLRALSRLLRDSVREIDIVTKTPFPEVPFAVLAMTATREQAGVIKARILERSAGLELPGDLRLGIGSFDPDMKAEDALIEQARHGIR